mgnify:FL=1|tara:strand:+ start:1473 stop:1664 length:192 start_codon:yes stop_codon:yes gene_type:complete
MDFKIGDQVVFNKLPDTFVTKVAKIISEHPPVYEVRYRKEAGQVVHECQMIKPTKQQLINGSN